MTILRYWGSHLKTYRQAVVVSAEFRPLIDKAWNCYLVLEREPEDLRWLEEFTSMGVVICYEPRPKHNLDISCISRVISLVKRIRPDVFMCENIHMSPIIGASLAGVPVRIWKKHAMNSSFESGAAPNFRDRMSISTRLSCALVTKVMAVSSSVRDELIGLGVSPDKVLVRPNARPLRKPHHTKKEEVRRGLGLSCTDVVWTSVGHAVPVKGWDMLIRAFQRVADSDARAKLLLVGGLERPEERETAIHLRSEIERLNLGEKITLTGKVEDVTSLLAASDGFVMSSHSEGCSIALLEALDAGLPCVVTRVGNACDVIQHGCNGMLVDRFNEEQLADALVEMTRDDTLRMTLAKNSGVPEMIPTLETFAQKMADDFEVLRNELEGSVHV